MTDLAERVQTQLMEAIDRDQLVLPTLPEVALRVREAAEDPDVSIPLLVQEISNDAALSARLIKVVNSPLLRTRQEITDLAMAVNRMGISYTANLATGLAMAQMFQATSDVVDQKMRQVWARSLEVAGISHVLCRHYTKLKADQATLGGILAGMVESRISRQVLVTGTMLLALVPLAGLLLSQPGSFLYFAAVVAAGMLANGGLPIMVVAAQDMAPQAVATASGMMMGLTWGTAGVLYLAVGALQESIGMQAAMWWSIMPLVPGALLAHRVLRRLEAGQVTGQ